MTGREIRQALVVWFLCTIYAVGLVAMNATGLRLGYVDCRAHNVTSVSSVVGSSSLLWPVTFPALATYRAIAGPVVPCSERFTYPSTSSRFDNRARTSYRPVQLDPPTDTLTMEDYQSYWGWEVERPETETEGEGNSSIEEARTRTVTSLDYYSAMWFCTPREHIEYVDCINQTLERQRESNEDYQHCLSMTGDRLRNCIDSVRRERATQVTQSNRATNIYTRSYPPSVCAIFPTRGWSSTYDAFDLDDDWWALYQSNIYDRYCR